MLFTLSVRAVDAPKFLKNYIIEEIENLHFDSQFELGRVQIALSENFNPKIKIDLKKTYIDNLILAQSWSNPGTIDYKI